MADRSQRALRPPRFRMSPRRAVTITLVLLVVGFLANMVIALLVDNYWRHQVIHNRNSWTAYSGAHLQVGTTATRCGWTQVGWQLTEDPSDGIRKSPDVPKWAQRAFVASPSTDGREMIVVTAVGWPLRAFKARFGVTIYQVDIQAPKYLVHDVSGAILLRRNTVAPENEWLNVLVIPATPIFPGIVLNSLLMAAVPAALLLGFWTIRRHRRLHRGSCPRCGYVLHSGATVCSECGYGSRILTPDAMEDSATDDGRKDLRAS